MGLKEIYSAAGAKILGASTTAKVIGTVTVASAVIAGGAEVRFVRGRLRFVGAEHPAPFPSAVVIFRPPPSPSQQKETNDENNNPQ